MSESFTVKPMVFTLRHNENSRDYAQSHDCLRRGTSRNGGYREFERKNYKCFIFLPIQQRRYLPYGLYTVSVYRRQFFL